MSTNNYTYTISEACNNVKMLLQAWSQDFKPNNRGIYNRLKKCRNLLLARENQKGKLFNSNAIQPIKCIEFIQVDASTCCNIETGTMLSRSKNKIPKFLDTGFGRRSIKAYTIEFSNKIDLISVDEFSQQLPHNRKYVFPALQGFIFDDYFFVDSDDFFGATLNGILENPEQAIDFNCCQSTDCCTGEIDYCPTPMLEREFNVPGYLQSTIENMAAEEIVKLYRFTKQDTENDARNETPKS